MTTFNDLGLSQKVLSAVADAGYTVPTPIQAGAIPPALERRDVLGIAQTGTGKTASFVLPMLTLLEKGRARARMPRTLILEPTRELAAQVAENFEKYGKNHRLTVALLIGGVSFAEQNKKLERGVDVLIATPGRLLDHVERGKLLMNGVELLVIDEADRMLDMGFIPDIERIVKMIPFTRQTLFFSATMPPEITRLSEQFLQNAVRVEVAPPSTTVLNVSQHMVATGSKDFEKRAILRDLINSQDKLTNAIIFCNRKKDIGELSRSLQRHGFSVGALHGDMDQRSRMATLQQFKDDEITLLVASDVAARGLDIPAVSHVFNYDVPIHAEDYVHRIGRTGRAGRSGAAFSLAAKRDGKYIDAIEKLIDRKIEWLEGVETAGESTGEEEKSKPARRSRSQSGKNDESAAKPRRSSGRGKAKDDTAGEKPAELAADAATDPTPKGEPVEAPRAPREPRGQTQNRRAKAPEHEAAQENEVVAYQTPAELAADAGSEAHPENTRNQNTKDRGGRGNNRSSGNQSTDRPNAANDDRRRGRKNRDTNDDSPVGFGDEIPAFMMISAKL